jgi:very-short-patch-repair endonuclease
MGPYVVDVVCLKARLVLEVDGSHHAKQADLDEQRTAWLASRGFKVLRFWDNDVLQQTDGVVEVVRAALAETPSLSLPARGREPKSAGPPGKVSSLVRR